MMPKKLNGKNILLLVVLIGLIVFFGFLRDFLFVHINHQIGILYYKEPEFGMPDSLLFLTKISYAHLFYLKWTLTLLFSLIYLLLACGTIYLLFKNKKYLNVCWISYLVITITAAIFMLSGYLFKGFNEKGYEIARYFMHMAQSPVVLMIIVPALYLIESDTLKKNVSN